MAEIEGGSIEDVRWDRVYEDTPDATINPVSAVRVIRNIRATCGTCKEARIYTESETSQRGKFNEHPTNGKITLSCLCGNKLSCARNLLPGA